VGFARSTGKGDRGRKWIWCKEGSSYSDGSLNPKYVWKEEKKGMRKGVGQRILRIKELLEVAS